MIDLKTAYEIRDVLSNKVIDKIEDEFGNIWYEAFKPLTMTGIPPLTIYSKGVDLIDYKIYGNSVQKTGTSRNLFDISKAENGSIVTADGKNHTQTNRARTDYIYLTAGTYCLSTVGTSDDIIFGGYCHKYSKKDDATWLGHIPTSDVVSTGERNYRTFTLDEDCYCRFVLLPKTGSSITNLSVDNLPNYKPQVEIGDTPTEYIPFGTYPSPQIPIEIQSVGEKTINLYTGVTEVTATSHYNSTHHSFYEAFEIGKTYTLFCYIDNTQGIANAKFRMSVGRTVDGTATWNYHISSDVVTGKEGYSKVTITIPDDYNGLLNMQYQVNTGGTATFKNIMLVEGSYALSNLPEYVKPYRIPIKVSGENLFNPNQTPIKINSYWGVELEKKAYTLKLILKEGKSIPSGAYFGFVYYVTETSTTASAIWCVSNGKLSKAQQTFNAVQFSGNAYIGSFGASWDSIIDAFDIYLIKGYYPTATLTYEPYYEPVTTNIYARFPLMKFGDYADYIDFEKKKIIRNVLRGNLNGSYNWSTSGTRFYYSGSGLNIKCLGTDVIGVMSSHLKGATWNSIRNSGTGIATYVDNRIDIRADGVWSTATEVNAYLRKNPISYIAPCLEPWEEEVELPNIPTNKGTNIIEVDTSILPSNMEVKYYGKE